jgi:hypothetical protein
VYLVCRLPFILSSTAGSGHGQLGFTDSGRTSDCYRDQLRTILQALRMLQCGLCSVPNTIELIYEILGIRPLLIDKLSNYCIPKDGVLLPRMDSYSSVLPLIVDPFIIKGCNYYGLHRSILIIEAEGGLVATAGHRDCTSQQRTQISFTCFRELSLRVRHTVISFVCLL